MLELFKEENGKLSTMRFLVIFCCIAGVIHLFIFNNIAIGGMLLGYAFSGKYLHKKIEAK